MKRKLGHVVRVMFTGYTLPYFSSMFFLIRVHVELALTRLRTKFIGVDIRWLL